MLTKILLAEDDRTNQKVVLTMLNTLGFSAEIANDGQQVIDKVKTNTFDLIFMDCQMPVIDGYEATRTIRSWKSLPGCSPEQRNAANTPIIALTAYDTIVDKEECIEAGMDDFMSKPFTTEDLSNILNKWINKIIPVIDQPQEGAQNSVDDNLPNAEPLIFEPKDLLNRIDGDIDLGREIINHFLTDFEEKMRLLEVASNGNSYTEIKQLAHTLKGAAGNIGAPVLQGTLLNLERASTDAQPNTDKLLSEVKNQFAILKRALVEEGYEV